MIIEPITISIIEYRALVAFLILMPSILVVAAIEASIWLAKAAIKLRVRK